MDRKKLALEVLNSPHIKKIASLNLIRKNTLHRMIAEEVMQTEAQSADLKNVKGGIRRATNPKIKPEQLKKNIEKIIADLSNQMISHVAFERLEDTEKQEALKYAKKRYEYASKASEILSQDPESQEVASAEEQDPVPEAEQDEIEGTVGGPGVIIGAGTAGEQVDIKAAAEKYGDALSSLINDKEDLAVVLKFLAFTMNKGLIQEKFLKLARALKYDQKTLEDFNATLSPEERERLKNVFANPDMVKAVVGVVSPQADDQQDAAAPTSGNIEIKPLLDKFANWLNRAQGGNLSEDFRKMIDALAPKDENQFATDLKANFADPEIEALKLHFEDAQNVELFFKQYFSRDPQFLEKFKQIMAGDPEEPAEAEEEEDLPPNVSKLLSDAYKKWTEDPGFMDVLTLKEQSQIFKELWVIIKQISGKDKSELATAERSITSRTATRDEESELQTANESINEVEDEAPENTQDTDSTPEPENKVDEFQKNIQEGLVVAERHSKLIIKVLKEYEKFTQGDITTGSLATLQRFGDSDPKAVLYKFVNLLIKDINDLLQTISSLESPTEEISESLLEVSGEKFSDKLRKVIKVDEVVRTKVDLMLKISSGEQSQVDTQNLSMKKLSLETYESMATIKEYFPTANPLKSEYDLATVAEKFKELAVVFIKHLSSMTRFEKDQNVNKAALRSARVGLEGVKKAMMELFGVSDQGKVVVPSEDDGAINPPGQEEIDSGRKEEPGEPAEEPPEDEADPVSDEPVEPKIIDNTGGAKTHIKKYLPPDTFEEIFDKDSPAYLGPKTYDALALFLMLTNMSNPEQQNEQKEFKNISIDKNKVITKIAQRLAKYIPNLDREKVENVVQIMSTKTREKLQVLGMLFDLMSTKEYQKLVTLLVRQRKRYPFVIKMKPATFISQMQTDVEKEYEEWMQRPDKDSPGSTLDIDQYNKDMEKEKKRRRDNIQRKKDLMPQDTSSSWNDPALAGYNPDRDPSDFRVNTPKAKPKKKSRKPADMRDGEDLQSYLARKARERGGASGGLSNLEEEVKKLVTIILNNRKQ